MSGWAHERLAVEPSAYPSDGKQPGIQMAKYKSWMGLPFEGSAPVAWQSHARVFIPRDVHRRLMRFRLCCWPLEANRALAGRPRELRVCKLCGVAGAIEDEQHVLLDCPAYSDCRQEAQLPTGMGMSAVMRVFEPGKLATLLDCIWKTRCRLLAT